MDAAMVRSFYRLPLKEIKGVLERLVSDETLEPYEGGYIRREDLPLLEGEPAEVPEKNHTVFVLHRNEGEDGGE